MPNQRPVQAQVQVQARCWPRCWPHVPGTLYGEGMAKAEAKPESFMGLSADGLVVAIIKSNWHKKIVDRLREGALRCAEDADGEVKVVEISVPGCFELPLACKAVAQLGFVDAIAALGVVERGATVHFELVSKNAVGGILQVQLETGVPIGLGILAVETVEQARERSEKKKNKYNAGYEAMNAALVMAITTAPKTLGLLKDAVEKAVAQEAQQQ